MDIPDPPPPEYRPPGRAEGWPQCPCSRVRQGLARRVGGDHANLWSCATGALAAESCCFSAASGSRAARA